MNNTNKTAMVADAEQRINAAVPEERRQAALDYFRVAIDKLPDILSAAGLRIRIAAIADEAIKREAPPVPAGTPPAAVETSEIDDAEWSVLDEAAKHINAASIPEGWEGTAQAWREAAIDGVRRMLEATPPPATPTEWAPLEGVTLENQLRGRAAVMADPRIRDERKAEMLSFLLSQGVESKDATAWLDQQLQDHPGIASDALRAMAPPGMFHTMSRERFMTKVWERRKKLGIN